MSSLIRRRSAMVIFATSLTTGTFAFAQETGGQSPRQLAQTEAMADWLSLTSEDGYTILVHNAWDVEQTEGGLSIDTKDADDTTIIVTVNETTTRSTSSLEQWDIFEIDELYGDTPERDRWKLDNEWGAGNRPVAFHSFGTIVRVITADVMVLGVVEDHRETDGKRVSISVRVPRDAPAETITNARHMLAQTSAGPARTDPSLAGAWADRPYKGEDTSGPWDRTRHLVLYPEGVFSEFTMHADTAAEDPGGVSDTLLLDQYTNVFGVMSDAEPVVGLWHVAEGHLTLHTTHAKRQPQDKVERSWSFRLVEDGERLEVDDTLLYRIGGEHE